MWVRVHVVLKRNEGASATRLTEVVKHNRHRPTCNAEVQVSEQSEH